jgi:two-component system, chemotaxis family, chemotaxis protein CheY
MHIGLLEDDTAIQEMLRLVIQDEGYTATVYPTADACLHALFASTQQQAARPIDLLIVDWRLTGSVPGTEVIRRLRGNPSFRSLPIILTTAATFSNIDGLDDLHVSLLEKPFAVDEVVAMIKNLAQPGSTTGC